jgi:hypothetical protein
MRSTPAPLSVVPSSGRPPPHAPHVSWPPPAGGAAVTGRELAERIARFYAAHPAGRIVTTLVTRAREAVVFRAAVYRGAEDAEPAATGWAASGWSLGRGSSGPRRPRWGARSPTWASRPWATRAGRRRLSGPRAARGGGAAACPEDAARRALVADLGALVTRAGALRAAGAPRGGVAGAPAHRGRRHRTPCTRPSSGCGRGWSVGARSRTRGALRHRRPTRPRPPRPAPPAVSRPGSSRT